MDKSIRRAYTSTMWRLWSDWMRMAKKAKRIGAQSPDPEWWKRNGERCRTEARSVRDIAVRSEREDIAAYNAACENQAELANQPIAKIDELGRIEW